MLLRHWPTRAPRRTGPCWTSTARNAITPRTSAAVIAFDTDEPRHDREGCRSVGKRRAQIARRHDATARPESVPTSRTVDALASWLEGHDRPSATTVHAGDKLVHTTESHGIPQYRARSAASGHRRSRACCRSTAPKEGSTTCSSALQITPAFVDQYLEAARVVSEKAIGTVSARPSGTSHVICGVRPVVSCRRPAAGLARRCRRRTLFSE